MLDLKLVDLVIRVSNPDDPTHKVEAIFGKCDAQLLLAGVPSAPAAIAQLTELLLSNFEGHMEVDL